MLNYQRVFQRSNLIKARTTSQKNGWEPWHFKRTPRLMITCCKNCTETTSTASTCHVKSCERRCISPEKSPEFKHHLRTRTTQNHKFRIHATASHNQGEQMRHNSNTKVDCETMVLAPSLAEICLRKVFALRHRICQGAFGLHLPRTIPSKHRPSHGHKARFDTFLLVMVCAAKTLWILHAEPCSCPSTEFPSTSPTSDGLPKPSQPNIPRQAAK